MSTQEKQNENLMVKLVKKSVGIPTGGCCSTPVQEKKVEARCSEQPPIATEASSCRCGEAETTCNCQEEKQTESKTR